MLVHQNTYLSHDIFGFPRLREGVWHCFCISAIKTIPSSSFGLEKQRLTGLGLRHTDRSNQVDKMGSDAIKEYIAELPLSSSYETAMESLSSLITLKRRGDKSNICERKSSKYKKLERMLMYLKILSLEEHISTLKIIHVAGTKGKGSTCSFCEAILRECGFRTGLFTSPHLIDVRERFRIDGLDISENRFLHYFWDCWNQLKEKVTEDLPMPPLFQFLTLLAFKIFLSEKVDVAIVEVGLGGLKDSTNVVKEPIVCGITSLGMDHMEALGDTLGKIASHKAGIFKPLIPAFTVSQPLEAMDVLQQRASELLVPLGVAAPLDPKNLNGAELSLAGDHQFINAGLAVSLCRCWLRSTGNSKELPNEEDLSEAFLRGLSTARLSGRSEVVYDAPLKSFESSEMQENSSGDLVFYLDGAHTPESMEVCAKWFSQAIKESNNSNFFTAENGTVEESMGDNGSQQKQENFDVCTKISKQVLLFNCMEVLISQKPFFVPSMSTYNKVTSATFIPQDITSKDLSWQFTLQKVWEKIIHGNDVTLHVNSNMVNTGALPSRAFLYGDPSQRSNPGNKFYTCSEVIPTLPLTIKWLRDCVKENPSIRIQVLVTGSLHLIGDVLKLLRRR